MMPGPGLGIPCSELYHTINFCVGWETDCEMLFSVRDSLSIQTAVVRDALSIHTAGVRDALSIHTADSLSIQTGVQDSG